jgi:hypothetical protein
MWEGYFDRTIEDDMLREALVRQFELEPSQVYLTGTEADITKAPDGTRLVGVRTDHGVRIREHNQFYFQVALHATPETPTTSVPSAEEMSGVDVMAAICSRTGARCLVSDESASGHAWLLVDGSGAARPVGVDQARLDEKGDLVVLDTDR